MDNSKQFSLVDSAGESHSYVVVAHEPMPGWGIMMELAAMVSDPLASALGALLSSGQSVESFLDSDAGAQAIEGLDLQNAGERISHQLRTTDSQKLIRSILAHVSRDGEKLVDSNGSITGAFNLAYTRNYGEMVKAVWEAVKFNGFLPLESISGGVAKTQEA